MTSVDIDTRSDIYSLGVLLYELLTGRLPFDSKELMAAGFEEMLRTIREKEPARPSARLTLLDDAQQTTVAHQRQTDAPKLIRLLRGDLDWIVMKCLEKERARRYENASGLALDLERHTEQEPVIARPPTAAYRLRKFIRRNQGLVAAITTIVVVLVAGVVNSTWHWRQAERARFDATQRAEAEERAKVKAEEAQKAEARARLEAQEAHKVETLALARQREALASETEQRKRAEYEGYIAKIALAAAKIEGREFAVAEELLDGCPVDLRHWEWGRLKRLCHTELTTFKSARTIEDVVLSPDGSKAFTFNKGQCVTWDTITESQVNEFIWSDKIDRFSTDFFREIFFLDGPRRALLASSNGRSSSLCDLEKGVRLCHLDLRDFPLVTSAAISPDGRKVLVGSQHAFAKIFNAGTGQELLKLVTAGFDMPHNLGKSTRTVAFSSDGRRALIGGSFAVQLWDTDTGTELLKLNDWDPMTGRKSLTHNSLQTAMFSVHGTQIITSGPETVRIWDAETGLETPRLGGSKLRLSLLSLSNDRRRALTITYTSTRQILRVWDLAGNQTISTLGEAIGDIATTAFSPDDRRVLTVGKDKIVRVWDVVTGTNIAILKGHDGTVNSAVFSANGKQVLTSSDDRTARLWEVETGKGLLIFSGHSKPVTAALFCPDGKRIVTTSKDKSAKVWSLDVVSQDLRLQVPEYAQAAGVFSPNGKLILTYDASAPQSRRRHARLWDEQTGQQLDRFQLPKGSVRSAEFARDGSIAIIKGWMRGPIDGSGPYQVVSLWETESGQPITTLPEMTNDWDVADVSPDARWVFLAKSTDAGIWDVRTGKRVCALEGFKHQLGRATFSPDGRHLMTKFGYGSEGSDPAVEAVRSQLEGRKEFPVAKIWDTSKGKEVCSINFYQSSMNYPVFTPDSKHLLTFGFSTCHAWNLETCAEAQKIEAHNGIVSKDSKNFFGTKYDGTICVIDFKSGRVIVSGNGHREEARITSISSDGKRFLTSSIDGTAKLWDTATARELLSFKTTVGRHSHPAFSPDDRQILITVDGIATVMETADWK